MLLDAEEQADVLQYLQEHRVVHLATMGTEGPHVAPLFYTLVGGRTELAWISDPETRHSRDLRTRGLAAASVAPSDPSPTRVEGVQLHGKVDSTDEDQERLREAYLECFPATRALLAVSRTHRFFRMVPTWVRRIRWTAGVKRNFEGRLPPL